MKKVIALTGLVLLLIFGLSPAPASGQFAVFDPINWIQNFLNTLEAIVQTYLGYEDLYHDIEDIYLAYENLKTLEQPRWRDLLSLIEEIRQIAEYGDAVAYSLIQPLDQFLERYPVEVVFDALAVHLGEDAQTVQQYWRQTLRDTSAGAFASAARSAQDEQEELNTLSIALQDLAQSADGRDQHAHAANMMSAAMIGQSQKTNMHLATLINLLAVYLGQEATLASSAAATLQAMAYPTGWDLERPYGFYQSWDPSP